ncbi:hypothetical protein SAMN06265348_103510 [Pedobacter westerhofensis]|uniref:Putative auto-transporter adhesin head GIN domain-containing protein n=1 Tax=Pedobacter westerhofensis TaxID=425512 RepID=A0A521CEB1_9SPHI|nr:DUF2807 domain-containing protein [Pedobacter westerhofensis]SMO57773.1 hypothetical protein SAMN06265348_103510 [Pedobacter westerhofensis]
MKTLKTLLASAFTAIVLSATVLASTAAARGTTIDIRSANPDIKKVVVKGNLRVFVVQSNSEWISMDEEDRDQVSIKQVGNTLTVGTELKRPVSITVYVKDIYRIDASDQACVKTIGKFNVKYLQVMLSDNATARIKASTHSIYTVVHDQADLELLGTTEKHIIRTHGTATMNTERLAALVTSHEPADTETAMIKDATGKRQGSNSALK